MSGRHHGSLPSFTHCIVQEIPMNTRLSAALLLSGCALLAGNAHAQEGANPGGMSPDTPGKETAKPAPEGSNTQDKLFVRQAALGGRAEVELSKIAQQKAGAPSVRDFAKHMVDAHTKSNQQLLRIGRSLNPEIPKELDAEHQSVRNQLNEASGNDFDVAYISSQLQDHQRTANLLQWHISSGQNEQLKKYSIETLPVVMEHLEMAKEQYAMLTMGAGKSR
jgi:putative membrane protein